MRLTLPPRLLIGLLMTVIACGCGGQAVTQEPPAQSSPSATVQSKTETPVVTDKAVTAEASPPSPAVAEDNEVRRPSTVAEAAKVIDLATFPMMPGAKDSGRRVTASLAYAVAADVKAAFEFQKENLLAKGCKELSQPQIYEQSASGEFGREGYLVSVSVFPAGEMGQVAV